MVGFLGFGTRSAFAQQFDTFMLIPGIPGDSVDARHANWIDVISLQQSWASADKKVNGCSIMVLKHLDSAGPRLWAAAVTAQLFNEIRLELIRVGADRPRVYDIRLLNAQIASITSTASYSFSESLGLTAQTIQLSFYPQNPDGSLGAPIQSSVNCN
jgi:type VI secretion system Hcp family effector